jgi:GR25 family glycosyltransferase involved in LPS biosynthesis
MYMLPVYVINLPRHTERREWMATSLFEKGISSEFINAIDAQHFGSRFKKYIEGHKISCSEAACHASHRKTWRKILASNHSFALVLEDDVHLGENISSLIEYDFSGLDFDFIKLEIYTRRGLWLDKQYTMISDRILKRLRSTHLGAAAYIISAAGARKALHWSQYKYQPVDYLFTREAMENYKLNVFQLLPAIATQDNMLNILKFLPENGAKGSHNRSAAIFPQNLQSSIGTDRSSHTSTTLHPKLIREISRPFKQLAAVIRFTLDGHRHPEREWTRLDFR